MFNHLRQPHLPQTHVGGRAFCRSNIILALQIQLDVVERTVQLSPLSCREFCNIIGLTLQILSSCHKVVSSRLLFFENQIYPCLLNIVHPL